uniref:Amino acid transporter transmembrane domain-containing protein n=1 Tax=Aureoumbra lagunensis TaxID=44058 RepID=A0A7S3K0E3_9STRA|mmetsp:Transcript_14515/g.21902  ORF Transcript_14515/g.21902 Transcript_14515/m.21902 type:complete len:451 (+) Transcript_14515:57-1409(+)
MSKQNQTQLYSADEHIPLRKAEREESGEQSTRMTLISMMKCSIGTGVLAIPHSYATGGIALMTVTLLFLAAWNVFSSLRLIGCEHLLTIEELRNYRQSTESPLAALARVAIGRYGAGLVEFVFFGLVFGVVTSYLKACHDTAAPLVMTWTGTPAQNDVFIYSALSLPLSLVRDVGRLAPVQTLGLGAICICLIMVMYYTYSDSTQNKRIIPWLGPLTFSSHPARDVLMAWAQGFGVLSFCFGIVPIIPQFQRSMRHRNHFGIAVYGSCFLTFALYAILGICIVYLDPTPPGNVLYELPPATAALAARAVMGLVCIVSIPLPVVAGVEIILKRFATSLQTRNLFLLGLAARLLLYFGGAFVAAKVPSFSQIVSIVGAAAVSFLSFVLPPLLHGLLQYYTRKSLYPNELRWRLLANSFLSVDFFATILGAVVVTFVTYLVTVQVMEDLRQQK